MPVAANHQASPPANRATPNICVIIATRGRPKLLAKTARRLDEQSLPPTRIIIACASEDDLDIKNLRPDDRYRIVIGKLGLPAQRNLAFGHVPEDCDYVVFFDDDFVADTHWLEAVAVAFRKDPTIHGLTGDVIADGIKGPGIAFDEAVQLISLHQPAGVGWMIEGYSPYGCNMAFRWQAARYLRFDERLVLYGWQEDRDFGAILVKNGGRAGEDKLGLRRSPWRQNRARLGQAARLFADRESALLEAEGNHVAGGRLSPHREQRP